jgi:hypothetical protein
LEIGCCFSPPILFTGARGSAKGRTAIGRRVAGLFIAGMLVALSATSAVAQGTSATSAPIDFSLFALTLAGIGIFNRYSLQVAMTGSQQSLSKSSF